MKKIAVLLALVSATSVAQAMTYNCDLDGLDAPVAFAFDTDKVVHFENVDSGKLAAGCLVSGDILACGVGALESDMNLALTEVGAAFLSLQVNNQERILRLGCRKQ